MTAVIIPFPTRATTGSQFEFWRTNVSAKHPEWDAAQVESMALLCMAIDQRVKRLAAASGGSHG